MTTLIRWPLHGDDALDAHEAQFDESAGLAHLDSLAEPEERDCGISEFEIDLSHEREPFGVAFLGLVLVAVGVLAWASLGYFLR
jgi:hypothetical protein